jgi:hypothetical protein
LWLVELRGFEPWPLACHPGTPATAPTTTSHGPGHRSRAARLVHGGSCGLVRSGCCPAAARARSASGCAPASASDSQPVFKLGSGRPQPATRVRDVGRPHRHVMPRSVAAHLRPLRLLSTLLLGRVDLWVMSRLSTVPVRALLIQALWADQGMGRSPTGSRPGPSQAVTPGLVSKP